MVPPTVNARVCLSCPWFLLLVVIISSVIPSLVISVVDVVIETFDIADPLTGPTRDVLRHIFDVLHGVVPPVLDVLRNVFDFLDFTACPASCVFRDVLDILYVVGYIVFDPIFVFVPPLLYHNEVSLGRRKRERRE